MWGDGEISRLQLGKSTLTVVVVILKTYARLMGFIFPPTPTSLRGEHVVFFQTNT